MTGVRVSSHSGSSEIDCDFPSWKKPARVIVGLPWLLLKWLTEMFPVQYCTDMLKSFPWLLPFVKEDWVIGA